MQQVTYSRWQVTELQECGFGVRKLACALCCGSYAAAALIAKLQAFPHSKYST
jgi:hypothetical protein